MVLSVIKIHDWKKRHPERMAETDFKYSNKERGFIIIRIGDLFKPSRIKRKDRPKNKKPEMTKKEMWEELFLHIEFMKELYPHSDGRLCRYCHQPWTYITRKKKRGVDKPGKRGKTHPTNFSIDRLDSNRPYSRGRIIFCCGACNDRKHDSTPADWSNFLRVLDEKT